MGVLEFGMVGLLTPPHRGNDAHEPDAVNVLDLAQHNLERAKHDDPGVVRQVARVIKIGMETVRTLDGPAAVCRVNRSPVRHWLCQHRALSNDQASMRLRATLRVHNQARTAITINCVNKRDDQSLQSRAEGAEASRDADACRHCSSSRSRRQSAHCGLNSC